MCTDTLQRYLRRILVSDFKQTKRWPIIPSLRRCQCSPPPAYLSMCTDTPQRYLRRILILDFKQKTLAVRSHFKIGSHFCGNPVLSYRRYFPSYLARQPGDVCRACLCCTGSSRGYYCSQALYVCSLAHCTLIFALFCFPRDSVPHACSDYSFGTEVVNLV